MNREEKLLLLVGRQQMEIEDRATCYATLLDLLGKVVTGEIEPTRVSVDRDRQTWAIVAPMAAPEAA